MNLVRTRNMDFNEDFIKNEKEWNRRWEEYISSFFRLRAAIKNGAKGNKLAGAMGNHSQAIRRLKQADVEGGEFLTRNNITLDADLKQIKTTLEKLPLDTQLQLKEVECRQVEFDLKGHLVDSQPEFQEEDLTVNAS